MPITRTIETIRPTQSEFGQIAYDVMNCVYDIHNEFGRFFDEAVYKRELANRGCPVWNLNSRLPSRTDPSQSSTNSMS